MLVSYTRSHNLNVGETQRLEFHVDVADLSFVTTSGARVLLAGEYELRLDLGPKANELDSEGSWAGEVRQTVFVAHDMILTH